MAPVIDFFDIGDRLLPLHNRFVTLKRIIALIKDFLVLKKWLVP